MTSRSKIWHHSINTWLRTQHRILWYSRVILTSHHGSFIAHYVGHNVQEWHFASRYANAAIARQCDIPDRMPASVLQWDKCVAVGASRS